jgi:Uma2 family endonuclease
MAINQQAKLKTHDTLFNTPAEARMSAEAYISSPFSAEKSDLIEGVFIMASPASIGHEDLVSFILATLKYFVDQRRLGKVLSSNTAYRLNEDNVYQPDVSFVSRERMALAEDVYFPGAPDIAVEVTSPSSRRYDRVEKKINYGRFGVREYWLIDPIDEQAVFYTQAGGELTALPAPEGVLRSQVLDGYWLQLDWLFPPEGAERPEVGQVTQWQGST